MSTDQTTMTGPAGTSGGTPTAAVSAIRAARAWPVFKPDKRSNFWINTLLTVVAVAASYGAALGQAGFAEMYLGMHGPERYVVFLIIEATAVALMLLANQTALAGDSAGGLWTLVWIVTAGAVTMQIVHANAIGQPEAAMVYATASVLTVVLWRAKTRRSLRDRLRAAGMIEDPLPRYRPVRWVLRPRETFRAWYLALGEGVSDPATAMDMARADRLYQRSAAAARLAVRRARRERRPLPDLTGQSHVVPPWRVTHPDARQFGVLPWHQHTPAPALGSAAHAPVDEPVQEPAELGDPIVADSLAVDVQPEPEPVVEVPAVEEDVLVDGELVPAGPVVGRGDRPESTTALLERLRKELPIGEGPAADSVESPDGDQDVMAELEQELAEQEQRVQQDAARVRAAWQRDVTGRVGGGALPQEPLPMPTARPFAVPPVPVQGSAVPVQRQLPAQAQPVSGSAKARAYAWLAANSWTGDARQPGELARLIVAEHGGDQATVARYVRAWRADVAAGKVSAPRAQLRAINGGGEN